jgi:hypothetical protein
MKNNWIIHIGIVSLLGACALQPVIDTSSGERTFDGLFPISHARVDRAWARADLDLAGYRRIKLEGAGIQYRPTSPSAATRMSSVRRHETDFPISAANRERLEKLLREEFVKEISKLEGYTLTEEAGPDVLVIRGGLLDVVSHVPPEPIGRTEIYLDSVGEASLMIELVDAETQTVLVRAIDRRSAERDGFLFESNTVSNWFEVRRLASHWARLLRIRLDELTTSLTISDVG